MFVVWLNLWSYLKRFKVWPSYVLSERRLFIHLLWHFQLRFKFTSYRSIKYLRIYLSRTLRRPRYLTSIKSRWMTSWGARMPRICHDTEGWNFHIAGSIICTVRIFQKWKFWIYQRLFTAIPRSTEVEILLLLYWAVLQYSKNTATSYRKFLKISNYCYFSAFISGFERKLR
jgi:hypothetical protein